MQHRRTGDFFDFYAFKGQNGRRGCRAFGAPPVRRMRAGAGAPSHLFAASIIKPARAHEQGRRRGPRQGISGAEARQL